MDFFHLSFPTLSKIFLENREALPLEIKGYPLHISIIFVPQTKILKHSNKIHHLNCHRKSREEKVNTSKATSWAVQEIRRREWHLKMIPMLRT